MRLAPLAAVVSLSLVACGGSDDDGGGLITDPGLWIERYVGVLCAKVHECKAEWRPQGGETFEMAWGADVDACKGVFLTPEQVRSSVDSGKAMFNPSAGGECLATLPYDSQTCEQFWATPDPAVCGMVLVGTVAAGGPCANGLECVTGLACVSGSCMALSVAPRGPAANGLRSVKD